MIINWSTNVTNRISECLEHYYDPMIFYFGIGIGRVSAFEDYCNQYKHGTEGEKDYAEWIDVFWHLNEHFN